jgi:hypothetical protein
MNEVERVQFIDWSLETISKWIGVPTETLLEEARAA